MEDICSYFKASKRRSLFRAIKRGIEKEALRITPKGKLSQNTHPVGLGSSLTHPFITTDYSEALLEFITPAERSVANSLQFLQSVHHYTYNNIGSELLWPMSMPCVLEDESEIPIADYGSSNVGKMKQLYRQGLSHRYGRTMQVIAGIHYNFSMPHEFWSYYQDFYKINDCIVDLKTKTYFAQLRNIFRYSSIIPYLFGASPTMCSNFVDNIKAHGAKHLKLLDDGSTYYSPYATSLRMSNLGYQNDGQAQINISYNDLESYTKGLIKAVRTKDPKWEKILPNKDGTRRQLNDSILQIENEYYSLVRPKRVIKSGESPGAALIKRGVEYIELRALDINPNSAVGITKEQVLFLDIFLCYCLLQNSPPLTKNDEDIIKSNWEQVVIYGRKPNITILSNEGKKVLFFEFASKLFEDMLPIANLLDVGNETTEYSDTLKSLSACIENPELTMSGVMLKQMKDNKYSFCQYALERARKNKKDILGKSVDQKMKNLLHDIAIKSVKEQQQLEESDTLSFCEYLQKYYNQFDLL